jgi:glucosamine--fructose-6-phosphate aminotransferase (isomerizing)
MAGLQTEVFEQPDALRGTVEALPVQLRALAPYVEQITRGVIRHVVFTGMGSSYTATFPAILTLAEHNIAASAIESSEFLYYHRGILETQTLIVAVSQSGRSVEIVKLLDEIGGQTPVIGVTNDPESPLATRSNVALVFQAGTELTVSSKTYTCTLATLDLLTHALVSDALDPTVAHIKEVADIIQAGLPAWAKWAEATVHELRACQSLVFLGRGPSRASAATAALITKETAKLPTEGMGSGQFRHGPMEIITQNVAEILFAGPGRTHDLSLTLAADIAKRGGRAVVIGASPDEVPDVPASFVLPLTSPDEWLTPIAEIVPIQLLAAQLAIARGYEVGKFIFGSKVTVTE